MPPPFSCSAPEGIANTDASRVLLRVRAFATGQSGALMDRRREVLHDLYLKIRRESVAKPIAKLERHIGVSVRRADLRSAHALAEVRVDARADAEIEDLREAERASAGVKECEDLRDVRVGIAAPSASADRRGALVGEGRAREGRRYTKRDVAWHRLLERHAVLHRVAEAPRALRAAIDDVAELLVSN